MPDDIRNPQQKANLEALNRTLADGRRLLEGALAEGVELLGATGANVAAEVRAAATEATRLKPGAVAPGTAEALSRPPRQVSGEAEATARANERAAKAKLEESRAAREIERASKAVQQARQAPAPPSPLVRGARDVREAADPRVREIARAAALLPGAVKTGGLVDPAVLTRGAAAVAEATAAEQRLIAARQAAAAEASRLARTLGPGRQQKLLPPGPPPVVGSEAPYTAYGLTQNEIEQRQRHGIPLLNDQGGPRTAGGGGRGQGPPVPPIRVTGDGGFEDPSRLNELRARAAQARAAESELNRELQRNAQALGLSGQQMQKHGYLTSEFIDAARRGQVTLRELGTQVTGTIAKFGAWTLAATAVYGVVGALGQLSTGALKSASGVALVNRIVTEPVGKDKAQSAFEDLATKYAVPIEDASTAVYNAAKVYGTFDDAVQAASVSLQALTVGELSQEEAFNALTGTVKGFGLEAGQLQGVFDAVNQAQNKLGGNTGQLVQGVSKAAGQFKSAGGDYRELVAILSTASQLTGRSPIEVATAVGRSAGVLATAKGAAKARAVGLDPTLTPIEILRQAQKLYEQDPSAQRSQALASALVPSQGSAAFARFYVPLIENAGRLQKSYDVLDPKLAAGSGERERQRRQLQPDVQLKLLAANAQALGSALSRLGAFQPFGLALKGANEFLHLLTQLVDLLTKLPGHEIVVPFLELAGALKAIRFFNPGGQIAPFQNRGLESLRQSLSLSPEKQTIRLTRQGLDDQLRVARDTQDRTGQTLHTTTFRKNVANANLAALERTGTEKELEAANRRLIGATDAAAIAEDEHAAAVAFVTATEKARAEFDAGIKRGLTPAQATAAAGIHYRSPGFDRPNAAYPDPTGAPRSIGAGSVPPPGGTTFLPAGFAARIPEEEGVRASRLQNSRFVSALNQRTTQFQQYARESRFLGASGTAAAKAAGLARTAVIGTGVGLFAGAAALKGLATGIAGMLGGFDALLIGGFILFERVGDLKEKARESQAAFDAGGARAYSHADDVLKAQRERGTLGDVQQGLQKATAFAINAVPGFSGHGPQTTIDEETAKHVRAEQRSIEEAQKKGALLHLGQIATNFNRNLAQLGKTQALAIAAKQIKQSYAKNSGALTNRTAAQVKADSEAADAQYKAFEEQAAQQQVVDFEAAQKKYGAQTGLAVSRARGSLAKAKVELDRTTGNLSAIAGQYGSDSAEYADALADAQTKRDAYIGQVLQLAEAQTALRAARTADPVAKARITFQGITQRLRAALALYGAQSAEYLGLLAQAEQADQEGVQAQLQRLSSNREVATAGAFAGGSNPGAEAVRAVQDAQSAYNEIASVRGHVDPNQVNSALVTLYNARKALADYMREQAQALVGATADLALSQTEDPTKRAQIELRRAEQLKQFARTPAEALSAQAEVNNRRRDLRQTRQQEAFDTINFEADIGKITHDAEVRQLEQLLHTIKGNRELRRNIRRQLYQLKHESDADQGGVEVNVGDIRLPTAYEVKRAVRGGLNSRRVVQSVAQSNVFYIHGSDAQAIGREVEARVNTSLRGTIRAGGS